MKKKITFFALLLLLTSCSIEFVWPSNKTSNKGEDSSLPVSISNSNSTSGLPSYTSNSNTEPINYEDIDIMLNKANKEDNLNNPYYDPNGGGAHIGFSVYTNSSRPYYNGVYENLSSSPATLSLLLWTNNA